MQDKYLIITVIGLMFTTIGSSLFEGFFQYAFLGIGLVLLAFSCFKLLVMHQKPKKKNNS